MNVMDLSVLYFVEKNPALEESYASLRSLKTTRGDS